MAEILVVEQDIDPGKSMVEALEREGHRTVLVRDGLRALGKICAGEYDLAILDVTIPGIDGIGLVQAIKKRTPRTMTIMICDRADLEKTGEAMRNGAYDFIEKAQIQDKLIPMIRDALREAREMRKSGYVYKDRRRNDRSLVVKRGFLVFSDSLLTGLAFLLAIAASKYALKTSPLNLSAGFAEIFRLSVGMAFCYAFSFVLLRSYRFEGAIFGRIASLQIWKNITAAYLIFLGILFFSGNLQFLYGRTGVLMGYVLGFLLVVISRRILIPALYTGSRREGRKRIVIVGAAGQEAVESPFTFGRLDSMNPGLKRGREQLIGQDRGDRQVSGEGRVSRDAALGDGDEIYIDAGALPASEVLSLLDRHQGRKVKVMLRQGDEQNLTQESTLL